MVRVRPGPMQGTTSGTLGSVTYRASRQSMVASHSIGHKRAPTAAQLAHREAWATLSRAWNSLDNADRLAWNAWADSFDAAGEPRASTAPNGRNRFMGWNQLAGFAGLPQLDAPTNAGVGSAEFALLDLFANVETGKLEVKMLEPFLELDASPIRIYTQLGPAKPRNVRTDPRSYTTLHAFDPAAGQPGIDVPTIEIDLPASQYDRPWYWGSTRTTGGDGNVSSPGVWPLETAAPGEGWAFRMVPFGLPIELNKVERTAGGFLIFYGSVAGVPFVDPHDLTAPANATIGDLVDTINDISPWRTTSVNSSRLSVASTDIPVFTLTERTSTSQPKLVTVQV